MKFSASKYTNPAELDIFVNQLTNAINALTRKYKIAPSKRHPGKAGIELWPLVHHTTLGKYYELTKGATKVEFWIGLDMTEEGLAMLTWFDEPDISIMKNLLANVFNATAIHYDNFGRYHRCQIDQFWVELKDSEMNTFYSTGSQKIIEDFFDEVYSAI
jgi:hypothetical protein